jgi:imidazolonepropionase-like amidohydrolase
VAATGVVVDPTFGFDVAVFEQFRPPPQVLAMLEANGKGIVEFAQERVVDVALLLSHGVRVVSGLDAGAGPPKPHGGLWRAIADLVRGGYLVDEALATALSGAAEACGLGAVTGRLSFGLAADLLVVDGDLRDDVEALARPTAVVVRGEQLS